MPYADTDFFIALLKGEDWLKLKAKKILENYKSRIWTSSWTIVEILMLTKEFKLDPENIVTSINNMVQVEGDIEALLAAAHLMKEKNMTTFDALHAVSCKNDAIISSDNIFDRIDMKRIKLEE